MTSGVPTAYPTATNLPASHQLTQLTLPMRIFKVNILFVGNEIFFLERLRSYLCIKYVFDLNCQMYIVTRNIV